MGREFCLGFILLLVSFALLFGCTSPSSVCGDSICSSDEASNCSCEIDCGQCSSPTGVSAPIVVSSIPLATAFSSNVTEINLKPLLANIDLSSISVPAVSVSGSINLPSKEDYFRIILIDDKGKEHLVFEAYYPLYNLQTSSFENICNETCNLSEINPEKLRIETNITDFSKVSINSLTVTSGVKESQKQFAPQIINSVLKENNESWVAGETSVSRLSYSEKKAMFGDGTQSPPNGFEYYVSGVFGEPSASYASVSGGSSTQTGLPLSWDWRNRNGKNWISPVKSQGTTGLCWLFASVAAIEAQYNLYYGNLINPDLSEEEFSCGEFKGLLYKNNQDLYVWPLYTSSNATGGQPNHALSFAKGKQIASEACLPFGSITNSCAQAVSVDCSLVSLTKNLSSSVKYTCPSNPGPNNLACKSDSEYLLHSSCKSVSSIAGYNPSCQNFYSINDFNTFYLSYEVNGAFDVAKFKKTLIEQGPMTMASNLSNFVRADNGQTLGYGAHVMLVVGYETDSQGRTVLIIKNSWGSDWGNEGYVKTFVPQTLDSVYFVAGAPKVNGNTLTQQCSNDDNDNYCSWGIGPKPTTCPTKCSPNPQDCDDSNPGLAGFDVNYNCINISSGSVSVTSDPIDANVYVGQTYKGKTPLTFDINVGAYNVLIRKDGYTPFVTSASVGWKQTASLNANLVRDNTNVWSKTDALPLAQGTDTYYSPGKILSRVLIDNIFSDADKIIFKFKGVQIRSTGLPKYTIDAAFICERGVGSACVSGTEKKITFNGADGIDVPDKSFVNSDQTTYTLSKQKKYLLTLFTNNGSYVWRDKDGTSKTGIDNYKGFAYGSSHTIPVVLSDYDYYLNDEGSSSKVTSTFGIEKIIGVNNNSVCGDSVCADDEIYSSCPFDCPQTKQCLNSEACCLNNSFKSSGTICEAGQKEFSCDGNKLMQRAYNKICSGSAGSCTQSQYGASDVNTICSQTCLSDTNTCSNYSCWPFGKDENRTTGTSSIGACKLGLDTRKCLSGSWSDWNVITQPIFPSIEVCDVNRIDESCDGNINEGCSCVNGEQQACSLTSACSTGKQTCSDGKWGSCVLVADKAPNTPCGDGGVCSVSGECVKSACSIDSNCLSANSCQLGTCSSKGDWNAACVFTNKPVNTICDSTKKCNSSGVCVTISCSSDQNCVSANSCQIGSCTNAGNYNSICSFAAKAENSSCGTNQKCSSSGVCTLISCLVDSNCANTNLCKSASCTNKGLWNSSCLLSNVAANSSCGVNQKCDGLGECKTIACTVDFNCLSTNPCQTGTCSSKGEWNSSCSFSNKADNSSCGTSNSCISGVCQKYSKVIYNSTTFNGASALATLQVDNSSSIDGNLFGEKEVLISSGAQKAVLFNHNFSLADLNLMSTTVQKGIIDSNRNYLIVEGLVLQGTKTIYLPKSSSNNAVCVFDSETNDVNYAKEECTTLSCPGTSGSISCSIEGSLFAISGLTHSFVSEDYLYCGDGTCNNNESCSSCAADCGACVSNPTSSGVACYSDAGCGQSAFVGSTFCSSNNVMQTFRDRNCFSKGTTASRCVATDSNKLITACSPAQTCVNGACVAKQTQAECTVDSNCVFSAECLEGACVSLNCANGFVAQNHSCKCDGNECGISCYLGAGICCENEWKEGKTTCASDSNTPGLDDSNTPAKKLPVPGITLLGIPIIYVGAGVIVGLLLIILILALLPNKKTVV